MRLTVTRLRRVIKRDFSIQFGREQLTSYGGLELLRRFLVLIDLRTRIQCAHSRWAAIMAPVSWCCW